MPPSTPWRRGRRFLKSALHPFTPSALSLRRDSSSSAVGSEEQPYAYTRLPHDEHDDDDNDNDNDNNNNSNMAAGPTDEEVVVSETGAHDGGGGAVDAAFAKRVVRKIDMRLVPLLFITYMLNFMDKTILSSASVFGLRDDTVRLPAVTCIY